MRDGRHPEAERDAHGRQRHHPQRHPRYLRKPRGGSESLRYGRSSIDEIPDGVVARPWRLHLHAQSIARPRLPQRAVVHDEAVDRTAVHREHGVARTSCPAASASGCTTDGAPIRVAEIERRPDVLARVPQQVEAVVGALRERGQPRGGTARPGRHRPASACGLWTGRAASSVAAQGDGGIDARRPPGGIDAGEHGGQRQHRRGARPASSDRSATARRAASWRRASAAAASGRPMSSPARQRPETVAKHEHARSARASSRATAGCRFRVGGSRPGRR